MKIIQIILINIIILGVCHAQSPADKLFEKYENKDGFSTVYISSYMFNMFANVEDNDSKDLKNVTDQLKEIKILSVDDESLNQSLNFFKEIENQLPMDKYKVLMSVKEDNQVTKFLVLEEGNKIRELLMISGGKNNNTLMIIKGLIDIKTISKLSGSMNIDGLDKLENMEE